MDVAETTVDKSVTMTANLTKIKLQGFRNYLTALIGQASDHAQPPQVAVKVRRLIQDLIDNKITPEYFSKQIQKELNSAHPWDQDPDIIPFIKTCLPHLQKSFLNRELLLPEEECERELVISLKFFTNYGNQDAFYRKFIYEILGTYSISPLLVNGRKCWVRLDEKFAIWFVKDLQYWILGSKSVIGQNIGQLYSPIVVDCPHKAFDNWKFLHNGKWIDCKDVQVMHSDMKTVNLQSNSQVEQIIAKLMKEDNNCQIKTSSFGNKHYYYKKDEVNVQNILDDIIPKSYQAESRSESVSHLHSNLDDKKAFMGLVDVIVNYPPYWSKNINGTSERESRENDIAYLEKVYNSFGFYVAVHRNPNHLSILEIMKKSAQYVERIPRFIFVIGHGNKDGIFDGDGKIYDIKDTIIDQYSCENAPHLSEVMKVLVIGGCRTKPIPSNDDSALNNYEISASRKNWILKNMFLIRSTLDNCPAVFGPYGSRLIQNFCQVIEQNWQSQNIIGIISKVSEQFELLSRRTGIEFGEQGTPELGILGSVNSTIYNYMDSMNKICNDHRNQILGSQNYIPKLSNFPNKNPIQDKNLLGPSVTNINNVQASGCHAQGLPVAVATTISVSPDKKYVKIVLPGPGMKTFEIPMTSLQSMPPGTHLRIRDQLLLQRKDKSQFQILQLEKKENAQFQIVNRVRNTNTNTTQTMKSSAKRENQLEDEKHLPIKKSRPYNIED